VNLNDGALVSMMNNIGFNQIVFSQKQIDTLSSSHFINRIDDHLKIVSSIDVVSIAEHAPPRILLLLEIYYNNNRVDTLSFDLNNYEYDDIIHLAKNIRDNEFLLQEVDNFLGGDIVE
jgi:hypothetical protein